MKEIVVVTGSLGLVGSAVAERFLGKRDMPVIGIDNDSRMRYFGPVASVSHVKDALYQYPNYSHLDIDIRDPRAMFSVFQEHQDDIALVVHAAAQPSHDLSATCPMIDFDINATSTVQILDHMRFLHVDAPLVFLSTNKVYGDHINTFPFVESKLRFDLPINHPLFGGVGEQFPIDASMHSPFGAGKLAADIYVQEYARYYGLTTVTFRCGCLTGRRHQGAVLHGFLAYLAKTIKECRTYTVFGYAGKQVRDNLHAEDVATAIELYYDNPTAGAVYNLGGGRDNSISVLEAIQWFGSLFQLGPEVVHEATPRRGDHKWWITDTARFQRDYHWYPEFSLSDIMEGFV